MYQRARQSWKIPQKPGCCDQQTKCSSAEKRRRQPEARDAGRTQRKHINPPQIHQYLFSMALPVLHKVGL